ncbi:hypothetical protein BDW59DRAFT_157441 [Aspergillus cavernicola]|uniref:Uncharacterized protein n=1 Tax=Aspergillus cavernicola TaxID=176166 RepID=A0ABR4IY11_9EURO
MSSPGQPQRFSETLTWCWKVISTILKRFPQFGMTSDSIIKLSELVLYNAPVKQILRTAKAQGRYRGTASIILCQFDAQARGWILFAEHTIARYLEYNNATKAIPQVAKDLDCDLVQVALAAVGVERGPENGRRFCVRIFVGTTLFVSA